MFIHEKTGRQFDTLEVLAVAYAAQRINKGYLKFTSYDYHRNILHNRANKEIVKNHFASWKNPKDENPDKITILESDTAQASNVRNHFKKYTFGVLANNLNEFQQDLFIAVSADQVSATQLGILAYVPEMIEREKTENNLKRTVKNDFVDSKHIGAIGDKFEGICKLIAKQYHTGYERFIYTAAYEGNILGFFCKFEFQEGDLKLINGKVKDLIYNKKLKVNETRLNYVKVRNA